MPAKKAYSQNFLIDPKVPDAIASAIPLDPSVNPIILEVGAGHGALTMPMLNRLNGQGRLFAVEVEPACLKTMNKLADVHPNLTVLGQNVLGVWPETLEAGQPVHVVGNLPYHMTGQILFHFCGEMADCSPRWRPHLASFTLMVQREVAERIAAQPGDADLNPLTWAIQTWFEVKPLLEVSSKAFRPAPRVQSSVIHLLPRSAPLVAPTIIPWTHRLIQAGFRHPRKTLKNNLLATFGETHPVWGVVPEAMLSQRAHKLPLSQWADWAEQLTAASDGSPA